MATALQGVRSTARSCICSQTQFRHVANSIGPGRAFLSLDKSLFEFRKCVTAWSSLHLGMYLNSRVYRTFCCSVFGFLWQIDCLPPSVMDAEIWALRRLAPGPGNWVRPVELSQLKHRYGHPFQFPSFHDLSLSAKLHVLQFE